MLKQGLIFIFLTIARTSPAQLSQKFDSLFIAFNKEGLFEGAVLIADDTGVVYQKAFGIANHEHKIPNSLNTVYGIGSISKSFTAMVVLQLVQQGKLDIDALINTYLPEYRKDVGNKVTIRHLLTHSSGIPSYTALPNVWEDSMQLSYTSSYILKNFGSRDLEFAPGTNYKYGNTGYFILAMIIERVTGKHLAEVLKDNIFTPLNMFRSGIYDNKKPVENKANGYYRLGNQYINEPYIHNLNTFGASGVHSTVYDLYLWDKALYTQQLLSGENMRLYTSSHCKIEPNYAYGFGWEFTRTGIGVNDTIATMEHSGAIRAFRANIFRIPAEKKCVILLSNCANQSAYELFENSMKIFRGVNWVSPKSLIADTLYSVMQKKSISDATLVYKNLEKTDSISFDLSSGSLELLGERLMLLKNYEAATAIFQLAVNENPNYTYGYYYLGRAFEKWGKISQALKAYETAVSKDKNSRPGIDAAFQIAWLKNKE